MPYYESNDDGSLLIGLSNLTVQTLVMHVRAYVRTYVDRDRFIANWLIDLT